MKKTITTIILISLASVQFSTASSIEKAKELMSLLELTKSMDSSFAQVQGFADQMISSQGLSPEQADKARKQSKKAMATSFEHMKSIDWETMFAEIYASVFTEEEIQAVIEFYKSPVGKKFIEKQPELMAQTMQKMQVEMSKIMPKIQADIQKAIQESKK